MYRMLFASIISSTTVVYSHRFFYLWTTEVLVSSGVEVYFMLILCVLIFQNLVWYSCVVCLRVCFGIAWLRIALTVLKCQSVPTPVPAPGNKHTKTVRTQIQYNKLSVERPHIKTTHYQNRL
jgi:hypothetical protein